MSRTNKDSESQKQNNNQRNLEGAEHCVRGSSAVSITRDEHASSDKPCAEARGGGQSHE